MAGLTTRVVRINQQIEVELKFDPPLKVSE